MFGRQSLQKNGSISHGDDRGEGGTSTTATDFIHDLFIKVKGGLTGFFETGWYDRF